MKIRQPIKRYTEVLGAKGVFKAPNSEVKLHYLMTTAGFSGTDGNRELLDQLRPLRERIDITAVKDLEDILQRDLSDSRVAEGIVEYLLREDSRAPIFFGSVIVVLIPKNMFGGGSEVYPENTVRLQDGVCENDFGGFWIETPAGEDPNNPIGISTLKLDLNRTVPLVIDGQHRTAAFRYVSGAMDFTGKNSIYEMFYHAQHGRKPEHFESDLPVTLLWFEDFGENSEVAVKEKARSLFVAINQSSQQIAKSRKILLDETNPSGFLTRAFYDFIADGFGYRMDKQISMFHSGFDYPKDLGKGNNNWSPNTVFVPEVVDLIIRCLLYNRNVTASQVTGPKILQAHLNSTRIDRFFGAGKYEQWHEITTNIDDVSTAWVKQDQKVGFADSFLKEVGKPLYEWLNNSLLVKACVVAGDQIEQGCANAAEPPYSTTTFRDNWKRIFCSGEGLWYELQEPKRLKTQRDDLNEVSAHFRTLAADELSFLTRKENRLSILETAKTIAFLVGYAAVVDLYDRIKKNDDFLKSTNELIGFFNPDLEQRTIQLISNLKNNNLGGGVTFTFLGDIDPKSWPKYRNIYIRFVEGIENELSDNELLEQQIFDHEWESIGRSYVESNFPRDKSYASIKESWEGDGKHADIDYTHWTNRKGDLLEGIRVLFEASGLKSQI